MSRKPLVSVVLATLTVAVAFLIATPASAATPVRIMPLGDSITGSPGCWRALLWNRLQSTGYTNIDFVGTLPPQGCGVAHDGDNEGHGGFLATNIANQNQLPGWLVRHPAGRRDHAPGHQRRVEQHCRRDDPHRVQQAGRPDAGQQPGHEDPRRQDHPDGPVQLSRWCQPGVARSTTRSPPGPPARPPRSHRSPWSTSGPASTRRRHHATACTPTTTGDQKMSDRWYPPLTAAPRRHHADHADTTPTRPSTTTRAPTTTTRAPTTTTATRSVDADAVGHADDAGRDRSPRPTRWSTSWPVGFQADVTVRNASSSTSTAWTATFSFANGQQITQSWNTAVTQSGAVVTARNMTYNGALGPGGSVTFGFLGSWNGTNAVPVVTCAIN